MLTQQHYFASRFVACDQKQDYKLHMCGLCHALGDGYGFFSRLITNHEMILLNTLTSAQQVDDPVIITRRCPLNPARRVQTNQDTASQFAAATAISLAYTSNEDDRVDEGGFRSWAVSKWLQPLYQKALQSLQNFQFDSETLRQLTQEQLTAENGGEPVSPTALLSAQIFAHTATLAHQPQNAPALATMGANYGAYLYLLDAYRDYPRDMHQQQFNPLRKYTETTSAGFLLTADGVQWLRDQFVTIQQQIEAMLATLKLYRYQEMLATLLLEPVQSVIAEISAPDKNWFVQKITAKNAVKAGLFFEMDGNHPRKRVRRGLCNSGDPNTSSMCNPLDWIICADVCTDIDCNALNCSADQFDCNPCDNLSGCDSCNCDIGGCDVGGCGS